MNKSKIKNFLIKCLTQKKSFNSKIKDIENFKYLEEGHIDSLELSTFISSIEKKFKIKLTPKNLSSKNFRSIKGLISIIEIKLNKL